MKNKVALITGITGQDGSIMAKFLLKKGYTVHGIKRRVSLFNTDRVEDIYQDRHAKSVNFFLHYGDVTDSLNCLDIINKTRPDEIYHFAAQSHVAISFQLPVYTSTVGTLGTLNILESIRLLNIKKIKFYNASSSEMYGKSKQKKQDENTVFQPNSPHATSKLYSYWITKNYRESYKMFATNGILFNHESEFRGNTFVTRKISLFVAKYSNTKKGILYLGNINSRRDWGYAPDYIEGIWKMLQIKEPNDFVLSTGKNYSVKDFIVEAFKIIKINIKFKGKGLNEVGYDTFDNKIIIKIKKEYFRPNEVSHLLGDNSKAKKILKWKPKTNFKTLVKIMVLNDRKYFSKKT